MRDSNSRRFVLICPTPSRPDTFRIRNCQPKSHPVARGAIACVLDLGASVRRQGGPDYAVVGATYLLRLGVTKTLGEGGGASHVCKEDRQHSGWFASTPT